MSERERTDLLDSLPFQRGLLLGTVEGLDHAWPLPSAPWFEAGASRTARRVFLGLVGEIAPHAGHAGHADIIRETIDGRRSMG